MRMEGHARTWFTPKQKAELWERWKPHCNELLPAPTTMAVMRCMAGSGSRKAWNASRDEPRSRSHQKEQAAAREEPPPGRWFWWWPTSDWLRLSERTYRLRRTSRCTNWSRAQPD